MPDFAHLHLHTEYSLLDGGNTVEKLVARVAELGMKSVAVTDHGNIFGAVQFYLACKEKGIKPILGVEAYVTPPGKPRTDRTYTGGGEGGYHLVLLAENNKGWQNLLVLCSEAFLTGFYYKPRIDRELLEKHSEGLIAINGHLGSEIGDHLLSFARTEDEKHWHAAVESAVWHKRVFAKNTTPDKPSFFVEMQHHIPEQNQINPLLIRLAREMDLPLVCDNDAHFLREEDHDAHDTLICISTGKGKFDEARMRYPRELYVKSPEQMHDLFAQYGESGREALENTNAIAARCDVSLPLGQNNSPVVRISVPDAKSLPSPTDPIFGGDLTAWYKAYCSRFEVRPFRVEDGGAADTASLKADCDTALRMLAEAGMVWRYGPQTADNANDEATARRARLERELKILADKGISAYFLIVWDFVNWGRNNGVPALARGSGVGTMVGYVLGLSNACPVRYGLLFERFTDPDRSEYPDIDIDLCQDGRGRVIDYVRNKYGHVAQIITFGTLKARAAIRDVGRVLEMPIPEVDRIAKLIPEQLNITIEESLQKEPDLQKIYDREPRVKQLLDNAIALEGHTRHAGVHAAGVIVATRPLNEIVPLYRQTGSAENEVITQWDGPTCEKMGLLKMDFLGLRTISIIARAKKLITDSLPEQEIWRAVGRGDEYAALQSALKSGGTNVTISHPLDLDRLSFNDPKVFQLFQRGETTGVFQFESGGMRRLLTEMKPDRLEDLIAANALFRPGPMDLIPDYNRRKHGTEDVPKVHEIVDRYTDETYGVMVYQEQVMQIVHGLGGIKLRDAYTLIKNISKKKHDKIEKERPKFVDGAQKQGLTKQGAEDLFELILKFAGYGFNKSHSTGYAIVAYQTAYLKTFFPNQYMSAFLTYESGANKVADWIPYLEDCRKTRFMDPNTGVQTKVGVEVRPPDINRSHADFTVVYEDNEEHTAQNGHVRFGIRALKGVSDKAIDAIIADRAKSGPFTSIFDLCERIPTGSINKAMLESFIKCGALDGLHGRDQRAAMLASIEQALNAGSKAAADRAAGQGALFGFGGAPSPIGSAPKPAAAVPLAKANAWTESDTLTYEKEVLGFYVSSHPLERWKHWSQTFTTATTATIKEAKQDTRVVLAAMVQSVRTVIVKNGRSAGQKMAILTVEDSYGQCDSVLFTDNYQKYGHLAQNEMVVFVLGRIDLNRGDPQIIVDRLVPIDGVPLEGGKVRLFVDSIKLNGSAEHALSRVNTMIREPKPIENGPRMVPLEVIIGTEDRVAILTPESNCKIALEPELVKAIGLELGPNMVRLVGGVALDKTENKKDWGKKPKKQQDDDDF